eukprot:jgi/Mesvir1/9744/Mv12207-RA.2
MSPLTSLRAAGMLPGTLRWSCCIAFDRSAECGALEPLRRACTASKLVLAAAPPAISVQVTARKGLRAGSTSQLRPCRSRKIDDVFKSRTGTLCQAAASSTKADIQEEMKQSLMLAALKAAESGAKVVMAALDQPRVIVDKSGANDIVTDTDKRTELAVLASLMSSFPDHLVLGEEGGVSGGGSAASSDYLWVVDPLDGTTNFAHSYPSFAVSVGVLFRGRPVAGAVVEFAGGPFCWGTRTFSAYEGE